MKITNLSAEQVIYLKASIKHEHLVKKPVLLKVFVAMIMSASEDGVCAPGETFKSELAAGLGTSYSVVANAISKLKEMNLIYAMERGVYKIPFFSDYSIPAKIIGDFTVEVSVV